MNVKSGALIATAVASMLTGFSGCGAEPEKAEQPIRCQGINACQGLSDCAGGDNSCKGMNECRGLGYKEVDSIKECTDKGGTVLTD